MRGGTKKTGQLQESYHQGEELNLQKLVPQPGAQELQERTLHGGVARFCRGKQFPLRSPIRRWCHQPLWAATSASIVIAPHDARNFRTWLFPLPISPVKPIANGAFNRALRTPTAACMVTASALLKKCERSASKRYKAQFIPV